MVAALAASSLTLSLQTSLTSNKAFAQPSKPQAFDVVKAPRDEGFSVTYTAANQLKSDPFVYTYEVSKGNNWILSIENTLSYVAGNDSKAVVVLREKAPGTKFIELQMYGGSKKYSVWVDTPQTGYQNAYLNEQPGWWTDQPIGVTYAENGGLTVTDGKRTVIDRLDLGGFDLGSIEIYGKDSPDAPNNAYAGMLNIAVIYGSPADTPIYFVPAVVTAGVGAVVGTLLIVKKRQR
jgi:hypothetical protein